MPGPFGDIEWTWRDPHTVELWNRRPQEPAPTTTTSTTEPPDTQPADTRPNWMRHWSQHEEPSNEDRRNTYQYFRRMLRKAAKDPDREQSMGSLAPYISEMVHEGYINVTPDDFDTVVRFPGGRRTRDLLVQAVDTWRDVEQAEAEMEQRNEEDKLRQLLGLPIKIEAPR